MVKKPSMSKPEALLYDFSNRFNIKIDKFEYGCRIGAPISN